MMTKQALDVFFEKATDRLDTLVNTTANHSRMQAHLGGKSLDSLRAKIAEVEQELKALQMHAERILDASSAPQA